MRRFCCSTCGGELTFDSRRCPRCDTEVAYDPRRRDLVVLGPARGDGAARPDGRGPCRHAESIGCNWLADRADDLCASCRRTRTVPDLTAPGTAEGWATFEAAKRRVLHQLATLPVELDGTDTVPPLQFDLLSSEAPGAPRISIGHLEGVVTLDVAEADLVHREQLRRVFDEPYRAPIGHVRHEVGHYAWDVVVATDAERLVGFRALFGDERADYRAALAAYYERDDDGTWQGRSITRYASAHPWEDVAETFAHLLHVDDVLETAAAHNLLGAAGGQAGLHGADLTFDRWYGAWCSLHDAIGALNDAVGAEHPYPVTAAVPTPRATFRPPACPSPASSSHAPHGGIRRCDDDLPVVRKLAWLWELLLSPRARAGGEAGRRAAHAAQPALAG